jgi:hypothetical protein
MTDGVIPFRFQTANGYGSVLSRRDASELCKKALSKNESASDPKRALGEPGVRCTRSLVCNVENTRVSHHRFTGPIRLSPRNGFNGLLRALLGDRAFLPPSPARRGTRLRELERQRRGVRTTRLRRPQRVRFVPRTATSTASHRNVRDDRDPPLIRGETGGVKALIWVRREAEYFRAEG